MAEESTVPEITFTDEQIAAIKAELGATDVTPEQEAQPIPPPIKRRRGRPRKFPRGVRGNLPPLPEFEEPSLPSDSGSPDFNAVPAKLTKREEKEVAERLTNILAGLTGMGGVVKPYIPMTEEEAKAIAEPLASYLVRNEPTSGVAREILENYDIVAMVMGVGAYGVRVYGDRRRELEAQRPRNTTALSRISERKEPDNGREPDEGTSAFISVPNASRSGPSPFDI